MNNSLYWNQNYSWFIESELSDLFMCTFLSFLCFVDIHDLTYRIYVFIIIINIYIYVFIIKVCQSSFRRVIFLLFLISHNSLCILVRFERTSKVRGSSNWGLRLLNFVHELLAFRNISRLVTFLSLSSVKQLTLVLLIPFHRKLYLKFPLWGSFLFLSPVYSLCTQTPLCPIPIPPTPLFTTFPPYVDLTSSEIYGPFLLRID